MMQLLVMIPFGDRDHNREGKKFSWNPDFVISKALHNSCSITFFSICSQNFGPSLKSPLQASLPSETRLWLLNNQQFVILTGSIFHTWYLSFFTQPQFEAKKFYTWNCVNSRQTLSREKLCLKQFFCVPISKFYITLIFFYTTRTSGCDGCDKYQGRLFAIF